MLFVKAVPKIDILILGTGRRTEFIRPELRAQVSRSRIVTRYYYDIKGFFFFL